jgi:hypothetical protein
LVSKTKTGGSIPSAPAIFLASLVVLYLFLACHRLGAPATIWDNLEEEYAAARWAEAYRAEGRFPEDFTGGYPLYHGRLNSYLMLPLFLVLEPSYRLLQLWPVAAGLGTLVLTVLFAARAFGAGAAVLTALLLVLHTSFTGGVRIGNSPENDMLLFSMGSLYLLHRWWRGGRTWNAALGLFLLGAGTGTRLWFVWFAAALAAAAIVARREIAARLARDADGGTLALCAGAVGLAWGLLPVAWHEASRGLPSAAIAGGIFSETGFSPRENLAGLWRALGAVLSGAWVPSVQFAGTDFPADALYPWFFLAALLAGARLFRGEARFVWGLCLFLLAPALLSPAARPPAPHYFVILYPFPQLLIALALLRGREALRNSRWALVPAAALAVLIAAETRSLAFYMNQIRVFGGFGHHTQATEDLALWLERNVRPGETVAVGYRHLLTNLYFWNPRLPLVSLERFGPDGSRGPDPTPAVNDWRRRIGELAYRRRPDAPPGAFPPPLDDPARDFFPAWEAAVASGAMDDLLLVRYAAHGPYDAPVDLALHWAVVKGRALEPAARFAEADGRPAYEVYRLRPRRAAGPGGPQLFVDGPRPIWL